MLNKESKIPGQDLIEFIVLHPHDFGVGIFGINFMEIKVNYDGLWLAICNSIRLLLEEDNLSWISIDEESSSEVFLLQLFDSGNLRRGYGQVLDF